MHGTVSIRHTIIIILFVYNIRIVCGEMSHTMHSTRCLLWRVLSWLCACMLLQMHFPVRSLSCCSGMTFTCMFVKRGKTFTIVRQEDKFFLSKARHEKAPRRWNEKRKGMKNHSMCPLKTAFCLFKPHTFHEQAFDLVAVRSHSTYPLESKTPNHAHQNSQPRTSKLRPTDAHLMNAHSNRM